MVSSVCFDYEDEDVSDIDFNVDSDSEIADMSEDEMEELANGSALKKSVSTKKANTPKKAPVVVEAVKVPVVKAVKSVKVPEVKAPKSAKAIVAQAIVAQAIVAQAANPVKVKRTRIEPDGFRGRKEITLNGMIFKSRSDAAKFLVGEGKPMADVAELCGMTYSTVYAVTVGKEKIKARLLRKKEDALIQKNLATMKSFLNDSKAKTEARSEVESEKNVSSVELTIEQIKEIFPAAEKSKKGIVTATLQ